MHNDPTNNVVDIARDRRDAIDDLVAGIVADAAAAEGVTSVDVFTALRDAWVAKGRPADPDDPYWAHVLEQQQQPRPAWVAPLVEV